MPPPGMWALGVLGLALSCRGAGAFVMHMASSCSLAANGSEQGFDFTLAFNKQQLVCYAPGARIFYPCHGGLLQNVAIVLAIVLNNSTLVQRAEARRQACSDLAPRYWAQTAQRRTPPQLRVVPTPLTNVPDAVLLTCHVWGFYPPEVSVQWLHGGDVVASGDTAKLLPAGDWTYQTQVDLRTTAKTGDTYTCLVQHASLEQPLRESWSPGLSREMTVMVAVAGTVLAVGLVVLAAGVFVYCRQPRAEGPLGAGPAPGPAPHPTPGPTPGPAPGPAPHPTPAPGPGPGPGPGPHPGPPLAEWGQAVTKL